MHLINIGFGNLVSSARLLAIVSPDSAPIKRLIQESRDRGMLIDATYGRKTAAVLIMDSDHVVLSALSTEKLAPRLGLKAEDYDFYLDLRKYGSARHAGFGLGFERCVMYLTGIGNIRDAIPFPRTVNNCEL